MWKLTDKVESKTLRGSRGSEEKHGEISSTGGGGFWLKTLKRANTCVGCGVRGSGCIIIKLSFCDKVMNSFSYRNWEFD